MIWVVISTGSHHDTSGSGGVERSQTLKMLSNSRSLDCTRDDIVAYKDKILINPCKITFQTYTKSSPEK